MPLYCQFPDLTELTTTYEVTTLTLEKVQTEFIFYLKACGVSEPAKNLGFTEVSSMNNWWPSHHGENRQLTLYWMRAPMWEKEPQPARRHRWHYYDPNVKGPYSKIEKHLAASGCGLKIGEPPCKASLFHKFFTLMRMPVEVLPVQKRWLTRMNYRYIDTGKLASYWVNGWPVEEYSFKKEYDYFKTSQKEWLEHGEDGY